MKVVGIYLAAGNSQRMGTSKLALPVGKMSLGSLALETALNSSLQKVFVIVQEKDDRNWISQKLINHEKLVIVNCTTSQHEQSASLRCGVEQTQNEKANAAMILLADQPFITVLMIDELINCMKNNPTCNYVATMHNDLLIPPVLFSESMFPELLTLRGDVGAKSLLQNDAKFTGEKIRCDDNRFIFDVDTKEDYEEFLSVMNQRT